MKKLVHLIVTRVKGPAYVLCTGTSEKEYKRLYGKLVFTYFAAATTCLRCKELRIESQLAKPVLSGLKVGELLIDDVPSLTEEEKKLLTTRTMPWLT